jgi:hypothetical protein
MSTDCYRVDLQGAFADDQAYVAISRATGLTGLQIVHFHPRVVKTNPLVLELNHALDAGRLNEFLENVPTWWEPVMNHRNAEWAELFTRNPSFKAWEDATPQKKTHGSKAKAKLAEKEVQQRIKTEEKEQQQQARVRQQQKAKKQTGSRKKPKVSMKCKLERQNAKLVGVSENASL